MRFAGRLVAGAIGILLFSVIVLVWSFRTSLSEGLRGDLAAALRREAGVIQGALPDNPGAWTRLVGVLAGEERHRVTILDSTGRALADNTLPLRLLATLATMQDRPEVAEAMAGRIGVADRVDEAGEHTLYVAIPGDPIVRVASSLLPVEQTVSEAQRAMLWAALLALAVGSVLALVAGRTIARPLDQLAAAARTIPEGGRPKFPRSGIREIDQLALALREVSNQLVDRFGALEAARSETGAIAEVLQEGVLIADAKGRTIRANTSVRRLLGYGPDDPVPDLAQLFRARAAREMVDAALEGGSVDDREVDLDGRTVLLRARALASGGAVVVLHDQSRLRHLEAVRRDFLANVSHELKTPLTSVSGYAETLLTEDVDTETRRRFLQTILGNARRMQALVEDQLSLARIESGRWQPASRALEVAAICADAWAPRAHRAAAAGITLTVNPGEGAESVHADSEAMHQILGNLFDNAIRFSPNAGQVVVASRADDGGVSLSVSDSGGGIGSDHLPRIFERYYRADPARSRDAGGTGLGLAIVKHLVEAHGGRVAATSELGRGTVVTCWFPGPEVT